MIFEKEGRENTEKTLALAIGKAGELGIKNIVVASSTGATVKCLEQYDLTGWKITVVTTAYGYGEAGKNRFPEELRRSCEDKGWSVCTAAHALTGVERSISGAAGGIYPGELIAATLKLFSAGTKVCVEICCMACDGGYIMPGERVVAIGGSGGGADTAAVIRPANSHRLFDTRIDELICKPITSRPAIK